MHLAKLTLDLGHHILRWAIRCWGYQMSGQLHLV